jgi:Pyruvate/2-oxoacid:ferredoxin oxidoreductase delta subunit
MAKRKIVCIDEEKCNGCGQCVDACAEGAIELRDGKARLVADRYCDGLAACLGKCPQDAISITEREAESFDADAVEEYLAKKMSEKECADSAITTPIGEGQAMPCGCASANIQMFAKPASSAGETGNVPLPRHGSELTHWPVQIGLIPPTAPFLKNADLLVASDCTPAAYPAFHEDLLKGKVLMIGCPKFDDTEEYVARFTQIFAVASIKSVTVAIMEVPCCSKMPAIIREAMKRSDRVIPMNIVVITSKGQIMDSVNRMV